MLRKRGGKKSIIIPRLWARDHIIGFTCMEDYCTEGEGSLNRPHMHGKLPRREESRNMISPLS